jgi:hypothetical protein
MLRQGYQRFAGKFNSSAAVFSTFAGELTPYITANMNFGCLLEGQRPTSYEADLANFTGKPEHERLGNRPSK